MRCDTSDRDAAATSRPEIARIRGVSADSAVATLLDRGLMLCHDARTGQQMYGLTRISPEAAAFTASPWAYNGKVFALSEDGDTFVVEAGPTFKLLGKNSLREMALATPAVAHGSLFIRTQSLLYRISKRTGQ